MIVNDKNIWISWPNNNIVHRCLTIQTPTTRYKVIVNSNILGTYKQRIHCTF